MDRVVGASYLLVCPRNLPVINALFSNSSLFLALVATKVVNVLAPLLFTLIGSTFSKCTMFYTY